MSKNQIILKKTTMIYSCLQQLENHLITKLKCMEDFLWPEKDCRIKLQILWLDDVDIQEVDQSKVCLLSTQVGSKICYNG